MDKLQAIVARTLMLPPERITEELKYNSIPEWDLGRTHGAGG